MNNKLTNLQTLPLLGFWIIERSCHTNKIIDGVFPSPTISSDGDSTGVAQGILHLLSQFVAGLLHGQGQCGTTWHLEL